MTESSGTSVLQITDLHLFADEARTLLGVDTGESLTAVLQTALADGPAAALLVTGDVTQSGEADAYLRAERLVAAQYDGPSLWLPGNHDLSEPMAALGATMGEFRTGDWLILAMDTHVDGEIEGHVSGQELKRVDGLLSATDARFVLVCGHHHPLKIGTHWLDEQIIDNADALLEVLRRHDTVRGYLFGHIHQPFEQRVENILIMGSPSTCFQFEPGSKVFAVDAQSPGFRWLQLCDDGSIETRIGRAEQIQIKPVRKGY